MIVLVPLLVCLIGMMIYALAVNGKAAEIGRLMFACGLLVTLFRVGEAAISILK